MASARSDDEISPQGWERVDDGSTAMWDRVNYGTVADPASPAKDPLAVRVPTPKRGYANMVGPAVALVAVAYILRRAAYR